MYPLFKLNHSTGIVDFLTYIDIVFLQLLQSSSFEKELYVLVLGVSYGTKENSLLTQKPYIILFLRRATTQKHPSCILS